MSPMRVLVREPIAEAGVELLRSRFEVDVDPDTPLGEIIDRYDGIVIRSATRLTQDVIDQATRLKVIGRAGVGIDNVDVDAATRRGIVVANAPESTVVSAAEQTIGLILALARNIPQAHAALKDGRWERSRWSGVEVAGKTLGVIGLGRIGQQVARRALGLGMAVTAYDPFVAPERFRDLGVEQAETVDELLGVSDVVTLHSPLTDETHCLIDRDAIARMRDGARLVNAARGALVDEDALAEALRSGKLAGAALDVFSTEPYDGPLLEFDQVIVTPHLAASTGRGSGSRGGHRRRADRRSVGRRDRHERREHSGRRPGRSRGPAAVHPARRTARAHLGEARRGTPGEDHRGCPRTASPSTTRGSSRPPRSTARSRSGLTRS